MKKKLDTQLRAIMQHGIFSVSLTFIIIALPTIMTAIVVALFALIGDNEKYQTL